MTAPLLELRNVSRVFDGVRAVDNVSLQFAPGEIVGLIGPNGAGKTTLVNLISGFVPVSAGEVLFDGQSLRGRKPHMIARSGIARTFQIVQPFAEMSVLENLEMGAHTRTDKAQSTDLEKMLDLFPVLRHRIKQSAGTLSGGEQEMLAIARALMSRPKLCIFDEPSLGLAPKIVQEVEQTIAKIKSMGTTILIVEQNVQATLAHVDRAIVMKQGRVIFDDDAKKLREQQSLWHLF